MAISGLVKGIVGDGEDKKRQSGSNMAQKMLPGGYSQPDFKPGQGGTDSGERHIRAIKKFTGADQSRSSAIVKPAAPSTKKENIADTGISPLDSAFAGLGGAINSLRSVIGEKFKFEKKDGQQKTRGRENLARFLKNKGLAAIGAGMAVAKAIDEKLGFFEKMKKFFVNVILGGILVYIAQNWQKLVDWWEETRKKLEPFFENMKKWIVDPLWNFVKWVDKEGGKLMGEVLKHPAIQKSLDAISEKLKELTGLDLDLKNALNKIPTVFGGGSSAPPGAQLQEGSAPDATYDRRFAKLLRSYEGLETKAYRDAKGIPTIGMGATYYPKGFRLQGAVKMGDVITEEEAYQIKEAHIREHRKRLTRQIGVDNYNKLPNNVKAALESIVFNYGSIDEITKRLVMEGLRTGDYNKLADDIENRLGKHDMQPDGKGLNQHRRTDEANIIRSGKSTRSGIEFRRTVVPPSAQPSAQPQAGESRFSADVMAFREFRNKQFGAKKERFATSMPDFYQIRELGIYGRSDYAINPLADDTNYEIEEHEGAGHHENRAFDIPVPISSSQGDLVAEFWRSRGYRVIWNNGDGIHHNHVHVEVPKAKAAEFFRIIKPTEIKPTKPPGAQASLPQEPEQRVAVTVPIPVQAPAPAAPAPASTIASAGFSDRALVNTSSRSQFTTAMWQA